MKKWQSVLSNIVLWGASIASLWAPVIPSQYKTYVNLGLGTAAILVSKKTSESNPDGTDSRTAYIPETKVRVQ